MNHPDEQRLIEYAGGDAGDAVAIERHLRDCAGCRESCEALRRVLAAARALPVPEPDTAYEARLWQRIAPQLEPQRASFGWREWFSMRRLAPAGAIAALVLAAFLAGRFWPRPGGSGQTDGGGQTAALAHLPQVRERILLVAVGDHLDRAQSILLEISNAEPAAAGPGKKVDISREQQRAEDLLAANRLYRQTAQRTGDASVADVLGELEPLLLEIANSPAKVSATDFEELRRRIEARGLLLKVRIVDSTVHEREKAHTAAQTQHSS
jgi:hypothetical protein